MLKKYTFALLLCFGAFSKLQGVGLLTQYHLGLEFLKTQTSYKEKEKSIFLLGVWLPGIWYVSQETDVRDKICKECSLEEVVLEKDPFKKGILFNQYLHLIENQYFYDSYFHSRIEQDLPFEIKGCYLNILEDLLFCEEPFVTDAKKLLNETLYVDIDIEELVKDYLLADVINWYYTIFISIGTHPLSIPDEVTLTNRYKGFGVNVLITEEILTQAKKKLPELAQDEQLSELISDYILCVKHLIEES